MNNQDLNFLDAIRMAIEAEERAAAFYDEAAEKTENPLGRELLEQRTGEGNIGNERPLHRNKV